MTICCCVVLDQFCTSEARVSSFEVEHMAYKEKTFTICFFIEKNYHLLLWSKQYTLFMFYQFSMDCTTPSHPVLHQLPAPAQTHVHCVCDAIQPAHPLSCPSPPAFNLSQHQSLCLWVRSPHQMAKVLGLQLQHQSYQWIFRSGFL